jgi:hypothetical protein
MRRIMISNRAAMSRSEMNPNDLTNDADFFLAPRDLIPRIRLLKSSSVACLLYLWSRPADKKGWIAAGASEIGRACNINSRTAFSALAPLEQLRLIKKRRKAGKANAYRLLWRRPRRPAPAKSADPTDRRAQTAYRSSSPAESGASVPDPPGCASPAAEAGTGGARAEQVSQKPAPAERRPGIAEQMDLLRQTYKACDVEEVKAACECDDEQLLKKLVRLRQSGGVAAEMPFNFFITALCSDD